MMYPVTISGEYIWTLVTSPIRSSTRFGTAPPRFFRRDLREIASRGLSSMLQATSQDFSRPPPRQRGLRDGTVESPPRQLLDAQLRQAVQPLGGRRLPLDDRDLVEVVYGLLEGHRASGG